MAATHFAAVHDNLVVGIRSSASRHAEGQGKFGPYTHAIYVKTQTTTKQADGSEQVTESAGITTWHGSQQLAQSGLRAVSRLNTYGYQGVTTTNQAMEVIIVPVVMTPKKTTIGSAL